MREAHFPIHYFCAGLKVGTLNAWLARDSDPGVSLVLKLARGAGVSFEWLADPKELPRLRHSRAAACRRFQFVYGLGGKFQRA